MKRKLAFHFVLKMYSDR